MPLRPIPDFRMGRKGYSNLVMGWEQNRGQNPMNLKELSSAKIVPLRRLRSVAGSELRFEASLLMETAER